MTAGFASRSLGEVGGVSRNRFLVDKMIVWRTILGLIVVSKWPAPESQTACRFSNDRRQELVVKRKRDCARRAPTPPNPRPIHKMSDFDVSRLRLCRRLPRLFPGASSPRINRKDLAVGRGVSNYLRFPKRDIRPGLTLPFSFSRASWFSDS
jgi:hypothetical protein